LTTYAKIKFTNKAAFLLNKVVQIQYNKAIKTI